MRALKQAKFTLFIVGLIGFTYIGYGEEFIIASFILLLLRKGKGNSFKKYFSKYYILFITYYTISTIFGIIISYIDFMKMLNLIVKYVLLPYVAYQLIPKDEALLIHEIKGFRNFIIISAIYGFFESILRYNFLSPIIRITAGSWMERMNNIIYAYQPSSFFLHYSFYATFLLCGFILLLTYGFKNRATNIIVGLLLVEQLIMTQSRICLIIFVLLILFYLYNIKKLTKKIVFRFSGTVIIALVFILIWRDQFVNIFQQITTRFSLIKTYGMELGSVGQRLGTILNWPQYLAKYPFQAVFGAGYDSVGELYLQEFSYFRGYTTPDNQYFTYFIEVGIVGFITFILLIRCLIKMTRKNTFNDASKYVLFVYAIMSLTINVAGTTFILVILFWAIGINKNKIRSKVKRNSIGRGINTKRYNYMCM